MKRPPGLWILLSAGVLWLSLQDVYGIRATALIFGKSSTSTTTTEASSSNERPEGDKEISANATETSTGSTNATENGNSTSPMLTGNPQIDYIWDPNLPQELNGYNLSDYPFYERVPLEEIEFKCDGLHDGFYASVPHKCQVYHHCLFGTRYDFLCANFTAFDMKTFICQFVSEVDCVNSKKFWHRNDALYKAQSTTTVAPLNLRAAIYTTAPPDGVDPVTPRRPVGGGAGRRPYRPTRRRRPQFDYYDDEYYDDEYYDDRPRSNRGRKRARPRPRPVYDDDYEEYEDERYESRQRRRRPYRDRRRNNKDRRKPEYDDAEEEVVEDKFEDEDFVATRKRPKTKDRPKQPVDEDEERPNDKRRPPSDRKSSRKGSGNRRPIYDDEYDDELSQSDESSGSYEDRPRKKQKKEEATSSDGRPIIKPSTGTIYDRPRVAPKINLPVPKNAADKFAYKSLGGNAPTTTTTTTTPTPSVEEEEEYEDEEYEEPLPKRPSNNRRPPSETKRERDDAKSQPTNTKQRTRKPDSEEIGPTRPKFVRNRFRPSPGLKKKQPPASQEYEDEESLEEEKEIQRPSVKNEKKSTTTSTTTTTTTTTEAPKKEKHEPLMRIIKRPFLPSRGGNPYSARGLQPIGSKAIDNDSQEARNGEKSKTNNEQDYIEIEEETQNNRKPVFKPSPALIKVPIRPKYTPPSGEAQELINLEPSRQQTYQTGPRTTQKPKIVEKNPLDLNEYDVTLNDALNPTLPNLPVRAFPTGFSSANDYSYSTFSRPRYVLEPNQNVLYSNKVVRSQQRYETVPQGQYRAQQGQTQAIYSGY